MNRTLHPVAGLPVLVGVENVIFCLHGHMAYVPANGCAGLVGRESGRRRGKEAPPGADVMSSGYLPQRSGLKTRASGQLRKLAHEDVQVLHVARQGYA